MNKIRFLLCIVLKSAFLLAIDKIGYLLPNCQSMKYQISRYIWLRPKQGVNLLDNLIMAQLKSLYH